MKSKLTANIVKNSGNIDALRKSWRIRNNEGEEITAKTETTKKTAEQNGRMQNTSYQQQTNKIQQFAPALLFSAINNNILFREVAK